MCSKVEVYADGSCLKNGQSDALGGWAYVIKNGENEVIANGQAEGAATSNRMELIAVIKALEALSSCSSQITVFVDSQYVKDGCEQWLPNWKRNNWLTSTKKPVKNQDLWEQLDAQLEALDVSFEKVRAHSGHTMNELVDQLARQAAHGQFAEAF